MQIILKITFRGFEIAWITNPYEVQLNIRGLSLTVETPQEGIEAEVLLIKNFEDLELYETDVRFI